MGTVFFFYLGLALVITAYYLSERRSSRRTNSKPSPVYIDPLRSLNWDETTPKKFRPFKPIYHITMGKFSLLRSNHFLV